LVEVKSMAQLEERRGEPRTSFDGVAHVRAERYDVICRSVNLSSDGMLLLSPVSANPGLELKVNVFFPPLNKWAETDAVLTRQQQGDGEVAWGLAFRNTDPFMGTVFRTFVHRSLRGDYTADPQVAQAATHQPGAPRAPRAGETPSDHTATSRAISGTRAANGAPAAPASASSDHARQLQLTPSESGLRTLYHDAIADIRRQSPRQPEAAKQKHDATRWRFWPFKKR
jgi:hypothetical protein